MDILDDDRSCHELYALHISSCSWLDLIFFSNLDVVVVANAVTISPTMGRHEERFQDNIAPKHRANIAIIAAGRSGSTLLMNLLALVPKTVFYFEPYANLEGYDAQFAYVPEGDPIIPRIAQLFDCSNTITVDRLQTILTKFACEETPWIAETPEEAAQCNQLNPPIARSLQRCNDAEFILLKILRLPWLATKLGPLGIIPADTKVIHLVRHPAAVLKSQYAAGWDDFLPDHNRLQDQSSVITSLANKLCYEMAQNHAILTVYNTPEILIVRYEDLVNDYEATVRATLEFIGADADDEQLLAKLSGVKETRHAEIPQFQERVISIETANAAVASSLYCQKIINIFYPEST